MRRPFLLLCLIFVSTALHAQWQRVGPHITHFTYGAISYKSGTVWVGGQDLYRTTDGGTTWEKIVFPDQSGITDICFLNADTGIVSTLTDLWQTYDHGMTWTGIARDKYQQMRVRYVFSAQNILAMASGNLYITHDAGKSWTTRPAGIYQLTFAVDRYGSVIFPDFKSTDQGTTWTKLGTFPPSSTDAWSIDVDSCDSKKMIVAVENYYTPEDGLCRIVNTTDGGATWTVARWWQAPNLSGALAVGPHTAYGGCLDRMLRSTDGGASWVDMPNSPGTGPDSRSIAAVNDNLLFVLDANGQIWKTINSGGDSLSKFPDGSVTHSITPQSLFNSDTLIACGNDSIVAQVQLTSSGCSAPILSSVEIIGNATASYTCSAQMPLTARVVFRAATSGPQSAKAVLHLSNGSTDTVTLNGAAVAGTKVIARANDVQATTLGDLVDVPITFNGAPDGSRIEFVLRYSVQLEYVGTFAPDNTVIDIAGQQWPSASRISAIAHDNIIDAIARVRVYNDSNVTQGITIDSIALPDIPNGACQYFGIGTQASIIPPSGCGMTMVSRFLHYDATPRFFIVPNPASSSFNIMSSASLENATLQIYDMIGIKRFESSVAMRAGKNRIVSDLASGMYCITIQAGDTRANLRLLVQ